MCETHFKSKHSCDAFNVDGYTCMRRDRVGRRGGCVALFIKDGMNAQIIKMPNDLPQYETLWSHVQYNNKTFICGVLYHPPKPIYQTDAFVEFLTNSIDFICLTYPNASIMLCGDFNALDDTDISLQTGLTSIITQPTRGTAFLDRVYTSVSDIPRVKGVKSAVKSDHSAIILTNGEMIVNTLKVKRKVTFRCKSPKQHCELLSFCRRFNDEHILYSTSVQECADLFYASVENLLEKFYPLKIITVSNCDPPYLTPEIKFLLRKKNQLMHSGKTECAGAIATRVGKLIAKQNSSRLCKIDPSSNTKDLWDEVRRLTVSSAPTKLPCNFTAQLLNEHYAAISQDANYSQPILRQSVSQNKQYVTEYDVFNLLDHLTATSSGLDGIPFWFIRLLAPVISRSLTYLYNLSLNAGTVPSQWKNAIIHPIPKIQNPVS